jgi:magnesium-transporting ATPase (P-type)
MVKHVLGKAIWMCTCLFVCMFAGEHFIVEPRADLRYGYSDKFVFPGRAYSLKGEPLYVIHEGDGASRHMTFVFTMFTLMQIINMFPARKIRDELNIFAGLFSNLMFWIILAFIIGGQIVITQLGSKVMKVNPNGLSGSQWGEAVAIASSILIVDLILKFIPDEWFPKLGQDTADDRRLELKRKAQEERQ